MLINDAKSAFPEQQVTKLISLVQELQQKHGITDVFGLNEVYSSRTKIEGSEDYKPVFMIAPGNLFPWKALADAGVTKSIQVKEGISNECIESPSNTVISALQTSMQKFGYNIQAVNGEFDEYTKHFTKVINTNYGYSENECISKQTLFIADSLAGLDSVASATEEL